MPDNDSEDSPISHCELPYFDIDTFCHHCRKTPSTPLKRCAGCSVALYCNKDCQKLAWAEHKILCRSKSAIANMEHETLGYRTPLSLLNAVKEWAWIHSYTLATLMHIALHTNGGVDHNLAVHHTMLYVLESASDDSDHSGHVSRAFRILNARIAHKDELPFFKPHWEEGLVKRRKTVLEGLHEYDLADPALAGLFPVTFMVRDTLGISYHFYEAYRPLRHPVDASPEPILRLAFDDLALLCKRAIALGIVFECPENTRQIYPEAGNYSQVGHKRQWKKISNPNVWKDVLEPMVDENPSEFLSGLPLELIWALFENW